MIDLVERLRGVSWPDGSKSIINVMDEAADEIERLRASERSAWNAAVTRDEEIERLRAQCEHQRNDYAECAKRRLELEEEIERLRAMKEETK